METARVGKVAVENTAYHFDKAYDYLIPQTLWAKAEKGCRVLVPFGGGNRTRQGLLMDVEEIRAGRTGSEEGLKSVKAVLDQTPLLSPEMLLLARSMKERYFCTLFDAVRVMLPAGLHYQVACSYQAARDIPPEKLEALGDEEKRLIAYLSRCRLPVRRDKLLAALGYEADNDLPEHMSRQGYLEKIDDAFRKIGDAMVKMVRLTEKGETGGVKLSPKQREVFSLLQTVGAASVKEVCYFTGVTAGVVDALVKKGLACCFESERYRNPYDGAPESAVKEEIVLTQEQQRAYEEQLAQYQSPDGGISLLYGVTGSGKTSVFLKLIDRAVEDKRGVILMVPEISLTPQMLALFQRRYGRQVAVFHSGLSMGERLDEWKRVKNGDALIALGTRSAVFAPFENLGLIIMDEEQEYTYKSEQAPRFHAREIAKFRCRWHRCLLTLASATPSVESYYLAQKGVYSLSTISNRYGGARAAPGGGGRYEPGIAGGKYRPLQLRADGVPGGKPEASPPVDPAAEPARISYLCELPCLRGAGDLSPLQYFPDLPRREPPADVSLLRLLHPLYRRVPKLPSAPGALCRGGNPESGGGRRGAVPGGENPADGRGHHYGEIFPREEAETIRGWGI